MQLSLNFTSQSKVNREVLSRQNRILFDHLSLGFTINTVVAREKFKIYNLHSRCSDLRKAGIHLYSKWVKIGDCKCQEYSLKPFS